MTQIGGLHTQEMSINYATEDPHYAPILVDSADWRNRAPTTQQQTFDYKKTSSNTRSASVTAGLKTTMTESAEVGVGLFKASESMSVEVSMSATTTTSKTSTQEWTKHEAINIAPNSFTNITCYVLEGTVNTQFVEQRRIADASNIGWVYYDSKVHPPNKMVMGQKLGRNSSAEVGRNSSAEVGVESPGTWFWFDQSAQTGAGLKKWANQIGLSSADIDGLFNFEFSGTYKGVAGSKVDCDVNECDINKCPDHCTAAEAKQYPPKKSWAATEAWI
jgi:hypothetical protein